MKNNPQVLILKGKQKYAHPSVMRHETCCPNMKADVSRMLLDKAMIAASSRYTEDSVGRAAYLPQTVEEIVTRVCDIADRVVDEWDKRGWLIPVPELELEEDDDKHGGRDTE